MRQVPNYIVIGDGKMATHFVEYLRLLNLPMRQWSRRHNTLAELQLLLTNATHVLFLIKDSAIEDFANTLIRAPSTYFIHFSGSLSLNRIYGAHPLMTFGNSLYSLQRYLSIPFITEQGAPIFSDLLPGLSNRHFAIPSANKAFYHALCVMSANFTAILWNKLFNELAHTFNIPPEMALPYLKQTCLNLAQHPQHALTGPLVRGDFQTIKANLQALEHDPFQLIYQAFCDVYQRSQHEHS